MKTPAPGKSKAGATGNGASILPLPQFLGTDNPRHLRALQALLTRPQPREAIDARAGCSNGPELVAELRRRGLEVPCKRAPCIDRDGQEVKRGIYYLTDDDRRRLHAWLRQRNARRAAQ